MTDQSIAKRRTPMSGVVTVLCSIGAASTLHAAPLSVRDMVEMKTVDSISISPDRRFVAYRVLTPSLDANRIDAQWFRVPLAGGAAEPLGGVQTPIFLPLFDNVLEGRSQWAPDSDSLFVISGSNSQMQAIRLRPNGREDQVSHDPADLTDFRLDSDGGGMTYQTHDSRAAISAAQDEQKAKGVVLTPAVASEGLPLFDNYAIGDRRSAIRRDELGLGVEAFEGPIHTRHVRFSDAAVEERAGSAFPSSNVPSLFPPAVDAQKEDIGDANTRIRLEPADLTRLFHEYRIVARIGDRDVPCQASICRGSFATLKQVDWKGDTGEVVIRAVSPVDRTTNIYSWSPRTGTVRANFLSHGVLTGGVPYGDGPCPIALDTMVCVLSRTTEPPRLVSIDLSSGTTKDLADPNASLDGRSYADVRPITWTDAQHRESSGSLVLPSGAKQHLPLVVTLSSCSGFLQGGGIPLAPEQILAAHGIAALCVNTFINEISDRDATGRPIPLAMHKAEVGALAAVIDRLASQGIVDRNRIGIVGHSFGAMLTAYAISHTNLFHAAVIGTGVTTDPASFYLTAPNPESTRRTAFVVQDLPPPDRDPGAIWRKESAALNASRIHAPLLLLPPENEYLFGLQLYTSIRDAGGVARMIVFPGEGHLADHHPSHVFEREQNSLDWLTCWLAPVATVDAATKTKIALDDTFRCPTEESARAPLAAAHEPPRLRMRPIVSTRPRHRQAS